MAYDFDEIQEEIEQENFFEKVRKWIPFFFGFAVLALLITGGYLWYDYAQRKRLHEYERLYHTALGALAKKDFSVAREKLNNLATIQTYPLLSLFRKLIFDQADVSEGYRFLAMLQLAKLDQDDYQTTLSQGVFRRIAQRYETLLETQKINPSLEFFFKGALDLLSMNEGKQDSELKSFINTRFFSPRNAWSVIGIESKALWAYLEKKPKETQTYFLKWIEENGA